MRWERELGDALRELARSADEVPDDPATERRLLDAFDARRGAGLRAEGDSRGVSHPALERTARSASWYLAAAASLALLAGAWWGAARIDLHRRTVSPVGAARTPPPPVVDTGAPTPSPVPSATDAPRTAEVAPAAVSPRPTPSSRAAAAPPPADETDEADEFIALPGAERLPRFESGMIVRVELDVTSLPAFGFPIMPDSTQRPVTADVLVGQDGQPRAIRLVSVQTGSRSYR
jgi:hypothetical protein